MAQNENNNNTFNLGSTLVTMKMAEEGLSFKEAFLKAVVKSLG